MDVREKLVKQAISHFRHGVSHDIFSEPVTTYAKLAIEALEKENGVTVDAVPVRHGRWKCNKPCPICGVDRFYGLDADIWADWEPPYCPNCGAKMDKEVSE